jgi:hypothetical protein
MADLFVGGILGAGYQMPCSFDFPSIVPGSGPFHNRGEIIFGKFSGKSCRGFAPPVNFEKMPISR